ncbi:uncharacterized protein L3040_003863 [Drepanopeziza brunnea f. sp. 'multigermtubi']|uniref:uncharacterized protein n=1 Tax=Drepanopeziza brunnea f. sp. 'multigermtubi' TaxID=698441 RepID=UPI00238411F3|nr:hypothetical protein L3040_003863 [Drepanopeziza brunnea f. sp. 'multigermtubi']
MRAERPTYSRSSFQSSIQRPKPGPGHLSHHVQPIYKFPIKATAAAAPNRSPMPRAPACIEPAPPVTVAGGLVGDGADDKSTLVLLGFRTLRGGALATWEWKGEQDRRS